MAEKLLSSSQVFPQWASSLGLGLPQKAAPPLRLPIFHTF